MKLIKPAWVEHGGLAIYSVDMCPDDLRFATGGQGPDSGRIVIWNIGPLLDAELEVNENVPKVLGQLDYHTGCVNCVRWNKTGQMLASCSDDKTVMLFRNFSNPSELCKNYLKQVDSWRLAGTLIGHKSDVMDLGWAPRKSWLASCSVDNYVIIWDVEKLTMIAQLSEHKGLVKGVVWDPLEQYVASQSNDKTLRVFRTKDWKQEAVFTRPFESAGDTTVVTRLDWSPDGQYIVCPNACKGGGPTARIIAVTRPFPKEEPSDENDDLDLVGHRKAICCVKFHPRLWRTKPGEKTHLVFASGSRDCSVAVWSSARKRPLAHLKNFITAPVTDLCWSRCGQCLLACSPGSDISAFHFGLGELGIMLSEEEQQQVLESSYGDIARNVEKTGVVPIVQYAQNLVVETPMEVETNGLTNGDAKVESQKNESVPKTVLGTTSNMNVEKRLEENGVPKKLDVTKIDQPKIPENKVLSTPTFSEQPKKLEGDTAINIVQRKQLEVRRADGKRRVTPISLPREGPPAGAKIQVVIEEREVTTLDPKPTVKTLDNVPLPSAKSASILPVSMPPISVRSSPSIPKTVPAITRISAQAYLEPLSLKSGVAIRIDGEDNDCLEVLSSGPLGVQTVRRRARANPDSKEWDFLHGASVSTVRSNLKMTVVSCSDSTLHFLDTASGYQLQPPVYLPGQSAYLNLLNDKVIVITSQGYLFVYTLGGLVFSNMTLRDILTLRKGGMASVVLAKLTPSGYPVLVLTNGQCIGWSDSLESWVVLVDASSAIFQIGRELAPVTDTKSFPLCSLVETCIRFSSKASVKNRNINEPSCAAAYIQQQMLAARHLGSAIEYKLYLLALVRLHAQEGDITQLRKLLHRVNEGNQIDLILLGTTKSELLRDCVVALKDYNVCERLCTEFEAMLEIL